MPNANGTTYNVSTADVGAQITFRVTAVGIGPPNTVSADSAPVIGSATPGHRRRTPDEAGPDQDEARRNHDKAHALDAEGQDEGQADPGPHVLARRSGSRCRGSTGPALGSASAGRPRQDDQEADQFASLKLTKAQKGKKVSVTITATKAGYKPFKVTFGPTAKVRAARR